MEIQNHMRDAYTYTYASDSGARVSVSVIPEHYQFYCGTEHASYMFLHAMDIPVTYHVMMV